MSLSCGHMRNVRCLMLCPTLSTHNLTCATLTLLYYIHMYIHGTVRYVCKRAITHSYACTVYVILYMYMHTHIDPHIVETHVDQHGRTYYMDHRTHTMAFEQGRGRGVDMRTRREMLDRRYCVCVVCVVC